MTEQQDSLRTKPLLEVRDLKKYFYEQDSLVDQLLRNDPVAVRAVDGVSFDVYEGETLGLVGESGCGKSTCGETVLRLQDATEGTVRFEDRDIFDLSGEDLTAFRSSAQFIFQDPFSSLDPRMPIGECIREPLAIHDWPDSDPAVTGEADLRTGDVSPDRVAVAVDDDIDRVVTPTDGVATATVTVERSEESLDDPDRGVDTADGVRVSVAEDLAVEASAGGDEIQVSVSVGRSDADLREERAAGLLERVGLSSDQVDRYPHEFSGGQRQRIGIARALALEPDFLVLDEPTSALDVSVQAQILNLLSDLQDDFDLTFLLISHDLSVIRHISDRVAVMYLGEIVEIGPAEEIFESPQHPYTQALLESVPRASTDERDRDIETLSGDVPSPRNPPSGCRFRTRCPKVIPPADKDIEQDAYRNVMDVRQRIEDRSIDLEGIRERLDEEGTEAVVERLADRLVETDLRRREEDALREAFHAVVDDEWDEAAAMLADRYESVCERQSPVLQDGWEHPAACHLLDQPAEPPEAASDD